MTTVHFDDALRTTRDAIVETLQQHPGAAAPVIVRGVTGRLRLFLRDDTEPFDDPWVAALHDRLGAFGEAPDDFVLRPGDFHDPSVIVDASDLQNVSDNEHTVLLLDRLPHGEDWLRPLSVQTNRPTRAVLFGIKGGVGRSTALVIWAWWLARSGKRVLVVDLDLESPGLSSILLPDALIPPFGVVDGLVEDIVGQVDDSLIERMAVQSPLSDELAGQIFVVSAAGSDPEWYTTKLLRASLDLPSGETAEEDGSFAGRLERLIHRLEDRIQPDVVLLDSRAGLHDIAAVALTRLGATGFLFAANTAQTWKAYQILFATWARHNQVRELRLRLQMVAATVPSNDRGDYLETFREQSWLLWQKLYDADAAYDDPEAFNFDSDADDAPHMPLIIEWEDRLRHFDPVRRPEGVNPAYIGAALGHFLDGATRLVVGDAPVVTGEYL